MNEDAIITDAIRNDTLAWFETHGKIWPKDRMSGVKTPTANYLQKRIHKAVNRMEELNLPVRVIGLKPRARGSTTYFAALGYTKMRRNSTSAVLIGGQSDQTVGLWNMYKTYCSCDRFDWGNTGELNEKGGSFSNGSRVKKETAKDVQAGIGDTYQFLHATEAARWNRYGVANASDVMSNLLKAIPLVPATYIFLESTAEGSSGDYYNRWLEAVDLDDFLAGRVKVQPGSYVRVFAPWFAFADSAVRLTQAQKNEIRDSLDADEEFSGEQMLLDTYGIDDNGVMRLGGEVKDFDAWEQLAWRRYAIRKECKRDKRNFDQDYPHSWQTAFQTSGSQRFNLNGLAVMRKRMIERAPPQHGLIEESQYGHISFRPTEEGEAKFTIFEKPFIGRRYIFAIDVMTGITQTGGLDPDYHAPFILRAGYWGDGGKWVRPATAARIIPCRWDIDVLEESVWRLARYYGGTSGCRIAIEMNMDRGLTELLKLRGANLYEREIWNRRDFKTSTALGFQTNEKTREKVVETLATAIREWDTPGEGFNVWCPHAMEQLENFVRKPNGRSEAAEGQHDDDVLALGIGLQLIDQATTYYPVVSMRDLPPDLRDSMRNPDTPSAFS